MALPDILKRLRNKLLADPRFLAFAQSFLLTRPTARRKSMELFDLLAGFSYSQVLFACVSLRILEHLGQATMTIPELASRTGLPLAKTELLVKAAVALDLLDRDRESVILGSHGAALLGQPWIMRFIEHHTYFYRDLEDPVSMLQGRRVEGGLRSYWSYEDHAADRTAYSKLMAASQQAVSAQVLAAYDFRHHRKMLDVGGGSGAFLRAVGERFPQLELNLFDLPGVVSLVETGEAKSITRHGGDFRRDPLPLGMDLISVVRVVHDHDDQAVLDLLGNIRKACSPATTVLIAEPFSGHAPTARATDAYFGLYFAAMGQGKTRTPDQVAELAARAGFKPPRVWRTNLPLITGLMTMSAGQSNQ